MNDEAGVLIDGFEHKPMVKQPWQHPYYQDLIEGGGLTKAIDLYMWSLQVDKRSDVAPMIWQVAEQAEQKHGIRLRHMRKRDLAATRSTTSSRSTTPPGPTTGASRRCASRTSSTRRRT